ncbi:MAG: DNA-formamidopyrimidine glycosylase [Calditrichaeota bacterium]|nr:DNA-formamidopyrimidine glycosylase [Calditrichota bacterium]
MPELPEVQTVVDELELICGGKSITAIEVLTNRVFNNQQLIPQILNKQIERVSRRGKYIVFHLTGNSHYLIAHLRMTGKFLGKPQVTEEKYTRCILMLNQDEPLYFIDVRQFGGFDITDSLADFFSKLGIEPLSNDFNVSYLKDRLQREQPIKAFLMDQRHIAGLGNIYADESLFLAKIHPKRPSKSLNKAEVDILVVEIKNVLKRAIANMGTTLSDYRNTDNVAGENQNYLFVYGREKRECKVCATVIEKIRLAGRGTHYCPTCQK